MMASLLLALSVTASIADTKAAPKAAPAAKTPDVQKMVTDDCARATKLGKACVMNFEHESIGGNTPSGTGIGIGVIGYDKPGSLIRVRKDFINEILKTAEDL